MSSQPPADTSPPTPAATGAQTLSNNIALAARVSAVMVLLGRRCHDRFMAPPQVDAPPPSDTPVTATPRIVTLEGFVYQTLRSCAQWRYEPCAGTVELFRRQVGKADDNTPGTGELPQTAGQPMARSLVEVLRAFALLPTALADAPQVLLIDAHLLFEEPSAPRDVFFKQLQQLESLARTLPPGKRILLRCQRHADLPTALTGAPRIKCITLADTDRDERHAYALLRAQALAQSGPTSLEELALAVSGCTEDWPLDQVDALISVAQAQGVTSPHELEELATAVALGSTHSPWAGHMIRQAVRDAPTQLQTRVLGQPQALAATVARLRQSVTGLSGAHQSRNSQAPRAAFFFAGPTGTGKTELAKALSETVFGQEQVLRFDCGELREEHAVARLIGAPPGYVGHDHGGELTEGVRNKPNCLVLMDEIEKAAPRLLDTFLGVLDDGRLTSGQGHTTYFGQAMVVFTSNLGMYEEARLDNGSIQRRPRFDYDTPYSDMQAEVREAVRNEFVNRLGRPELLGRIGGAQNIVVFDFLRDLNGVARKFVRNVSVRCASAHRIDLAVAEDVIQHIASTTRQDPEALLLGGRGLAQHLERLLVLPLSNFIFETDPLGKTVQAHMGADGVVFHVK